MSCEKTQTIERNFKLIEFLSSALDFNSIQSLNADLFENLNNLTFM